MIARRTALIFAMAMAVAGRTSAQGTLDCPSPDIGTYEAIFHIGEWFRARGVPIPMPAFLEVVPFRFGVSDLAQHYHLPLKMTPWGFSLFRGGA